jgi:hypothetical protein
MTIPLWALVVGSVLAVLGYLAVGCACLIVVIEMDEKVRKLDHDEAVMWVLMGWPVFFPILWIGLWNARRNLSCDD